MQWCFFGVYEKGNHRKPKSIDASQTPLPEPADFGLFGSHRSWLSFFRSRCFFDTRYALLWFPDDCWFGHSGTHLAEATGMTSSLLERNHGGYDRSGRSAKPGRRSSFDKRTHWLKQGRNTRVGFPFSSPSLAPPKNGT